MKSIETNRMRLIERIAPSGVAVLGCLVVTVLIPILFISELEISITRTR